MQMSNRMAGSFPKVQDVSLLSCCLGHRCDGWNFIVLLTTRRTRVGPGKLIEDGEAGSRPSLMTSPEFPYSVSLKLSWVCVQPSLYPLSTLILSLLLWNILLHSPFSGFLLPETITFLHLFTCRSLVSLIEREEPCLTCNFISISYNSHWPVMRAFQYYFESFYVASDENVCLRTYFHNYYFFYSALEWLGRPQSFWLDRIEAIKPYLNWNDFVLSHCKTSALWGVGTYAAMWVLPIASTQPESKFLY